MSYQEQPWWQRTPLLFGSVVLVLIVLTGGIFLGTQIGDEPNRPSTEKPTRNAEASSSRCDLPDGSSTAIEPPTSNLRWLVSDGLLAPAHADYGPADTVDGVHSCFARNAMGAVFGAYWYFVDSESVDSGARALVTQRVAPGDARDAVLKALDDPSMPSPTAGPGELVPLGYRILSQAGPDEVELELLLRPQNQGKADLGMRLFMVWIDGDWLVDPSRPSNFPEISSYQALPNDFTLWSSSQEQESNSPSSAGGLNRPAPGFARLEPTKAAVGPECVVMPALCVVKEVIDRTDVLDTAKDKVTDFTAGLANSAFGRIAQSAVEAAEWSLKTLLTSWLKYPDPKVSECYGGTVDCAAASDNVDTWVQANLHWLVLFAMVATVMVGALRIALTGRFEHGRDLAAALTKTVVVAFAGGLIIVTSLEASDIFAQWILTQVDVDLASGMGMAAFGTAQANPFLLLIMALVIVLTQLIQVGLMIIRGGMVIMLAGILPLAASMGNTQVGKAWFTKACGWLAAWILYKPVAALVYAMAIKMTNGGQDVATQLSGMFLMILAVLALPALMKFLVPAVSAAAGGNSGAIAGAMVGGAVATGAMVATGGMSAGAAGAGGGFSGFSSASQLGGGSGGSSGSGGVASSPTGAAPSGGSGTSSGASGSTITDPAGQGSGDEGGGQGAGSQTASQTSGAQTTGGQGTSPPSPSGGEVGS